MLIYICCNQGTKHKSFIWSRGIWTFADFGCRRVRNLTDDTRNNFWIKIFRRSRVQINMTNNTWKSVTDRIRLFMDKKISILFILMIISIWYSDIKGLNPSYFRFWKYWEEITVGLFGIVFLLFLFSRQTNYLWELNLISMEFYQYREY